MKQPKENEGLIQKTTFPERFKQFLSQESSIKNIDDYDTKAVNNRVLLEDHRITHAWASEILEGKKFKHTIKEVQQLHDKISEEIKARGFAHNTPIQLSNSAMQQLVRYRRFKLESTPDNTETALIDETLFEAFDEFMLAKRKFRFTYQHNSKENSEHRDMYFELSNRKTLERYSFKIKEKETYKEFGQQFNQKILAVKKPSQHITQMNINGNKKSFRLYNILDQGFYELGTDKPFFKEYLIDGKIFKGRYIYRKLPRSGNLKDAGKVPWVWFFWKPENQTPYILSARASRKQDWPIGKDAASWLSDEWEQKIPDEYRWWLQNLDRKESALMIKEARKHLLEKNEISEEYEEKIKFTLDRHWWEGKKEIRDLPIEHWDLRLSNGREWTLDKNPVLNPKDINAKYQMRHDIKSNLEVNDDKIIPPGKEGNPNKKIPAHVDTLDNGTATIVADDENSMSIELDGKHLKGLFSFRNTDKEENQWVMNKGKLPQSMQIMLSNFDIEQIIDLSDEQLHLSRSEIARLVGCSNTAVYAWQKRSEII